MNNLKPYSNYKPSGVEWLGDVPVHWEITKLKNIIKEKITDGPHETPIFLDSGIPFLSVDGIQEGELTFEKCRFISKKAHQQYLKKCKVEKYDILMGKAASIGKIAQVKVDFEFSIWSPLALIKPNLSKIQSSFLEYVLKNQTTQTQIELLCTINTQKNISMGDIPKIILPLPPKTEQTKIANYLDRKTAQIDEAIAQKEQLIALLKERQQILIHQAVTQGLDSSVELKDSGVEWIGKVPKHWEVKRAKYIFKIQKRIAGKLGYKVLSITQKGIKVKDITSGEGQLAMDYSKYQLAYKGDFAMNHMDLLTGYVDISNYDGVISPDYRVFENLPNETYKEYLLKLLQLCYKEKIFFAHGRGVSMLGRWRLPSQNFYNFQFPIPPIKEQIEIANYIDTQTEKIQTAIRLKEQEIEKLKEYKTVLIDAAVTGKVLIEN